METKNRLRELRKKRGLTQQEVASYIGITQNAYSYWENGKVKIDNTSLQRLADYFDVSIDYLLGREEKKSVMQRPTSELVEKYQHLFYDSDFVKIAKIYDNIQEAVVKGILVGYFLAAAKANGVDTSIVGY